MTARRASTIHDPADDMAAQQGATPPAWLHRSRFRLLLDVLAGVRTNLDKLGQLASLLLALFRPRLVRQRLERLRALGHIDVLPSLPQLLVAARDQMIISATEETRLFYRSQNIPWVFHNLRRFISGPATMLDPVGLFSPRATIIEHVLQTFHRHPVYDLVLLRAYPGGIEAMESAAAALVAGTHPKQRLLTSLIEDGAYHQRLPAEIAAFKANPHLPARPIPPGLVSEPGLMLGMDQFKDIRGFTSYAARLDAGWAAAVGAWLRVAFDETLGGPLRTRLGPRQVRLDACEPHLVAKYF
jgi:hypothetical protein